MKKRFGVSEANKGYIYLYIAVSTIFGGIGSNWVGPIIMAVIFVLLVEKLPKIAPYIVLFFGFGEWGMVGEKLFGEDGVAFGLVGVVVGYFAFLYPEEKDVQNEQAVEVEVLDEKSEEVENNEIKSSLEKVEIQEQEKENDPANGLKKGKLENSNIIKF